MFEYSPSETKCSSAAVSMGNNTSLTRIAACHASPVFLDAKETTKKAVSLIQEAASHDANIVVFPESYIPGFPIWSALRAPTENHRFFRKMATESVFVDGEEVAAVQAAAKQHGVVVSLGFSEKVRYSSATLFNANVLVGADGRILVHHRKLVPTFYEKLTWAPGDGHGLAVAETPFGKVGALICGENTNPLALYTMTAQGEQIHVSTWPAVWPTRPPYGDPPDLDILNIASSSKRDTRASRGAGYDNVGANRTRAAAHCFEAKCFGVLCAGALSEDAAALASFGSSDPDAVAQWLLSLPRGATMFLDTTGTLLPGFTFASSDSEKCVTEFLQKDEGILYADVDLDDCIEGKQYHDLAGGYQRLDVFELKVDRTRREPVTFK
ncbi:nitrilase [Daldinia caldariorum]|uniref:nitrilase n=1 Tax=Daldinia caldariorum TaxID=326644 RepID=UPI00200830A4|nr:nitrilase [Daldinia caldariorum]KAI1468593.1 nitrilase [Daldinia caldariorum]